MAASPYVELHAHSAFSFLDGASTPTELAARAAALEHPALALTDHDGLWGSMEFAHACKGYGVKPITGAELTVALSRDAEPELAHLTLLVEEPVGYRNLCRLLSAAHSHTRAGAQRAAGQPWVPLDAVLDRAEGLVCLSGCARDGVVNIVVSELAALEWSGEPQEDVRRIEPTDRTSPVDVDDLSATRRARELAVAELRAVVPAGHSFGRRGR
jgi:DNA polymerase III alpha subunit